MARKLQKGGRSPLQSGVTVDKTTNMAKIYQNFSPVDSFPVITGQNSDANSPISKYNFRQIEANPKYRVTPAGNYQMEPMDDVYGYKAFDMYNPKLSNYNRVHVTYPDEAAKRNPTYKSKDPRKRDLSYGCINCRKEDIDKLYRYFPQGDTLQVMPRVTPEAPYVYGQPPISETERQTYTPYQQGGKVEIRKFENGGTVMKRVRISGTPMQYGGANPYIPYVTGNAPVTPDERMGYNNYRSALTKGTGAYVRDLNRNEEYQKQVAQEMGWDYSRNAAIQADMQQRNQSMPGTVSGMNIADTWGGNPNWLGTRERNKSYNEYEYIHKDPKGNIYPGAAGRYNAGTEPMTEAQANRWANTAYNQPKQWKANSQGVSSEAPQSEIDKLYQPAKPTASAFPTREQAISKWQSRGKTSVGQVDGPAPDYSLDAVRSQYAKYGGQMEGGTQSNRRVRISGIPAMATGGSTSMPGGQGGYGNQQKGHGYALDRFWSSPAGYLGSTSQVQPFARIGNTLPEAEDGGDINAEKQEQVLGDFDQDGGLELMNVGGKPHSEGGKDVNVPSNSFVFSDTKDLKIKDEKVLAMFGLKPKRGGYTPAEIAKKYDLNKYKAVTANPDADNYATTTAQLMSDNYLAKLSKLAHIQEEMKRHMGMENSAQGVPGQPQEAIVKYGGRYQAGGVVNETNEDTNDAIAQLVNPVYNMYPGTLTAEGYPHERPSAGNMQSFIQQSIQPRPQQGYDKPIIPGTEAGNAQYDMMRRMGWNGQEDPGQWAQRTQPDAVKRAISASGMKQDAADAVSGNSLGNTYYGPRWRNFMPGPPEWNPPMETINGIGQPEATPGMVPASPIASPASPADIPNSEMSKYVKDKGKKKRNPFNFDVDPNLYGNLMNVMQMANVKKFQPYEAAPQAVIPDTVFMDPTRIIAAQQEMARSAGEGDDSTPQGRAMSLGRQGLAGSQAADVIGQVHNQNVGIANQAGREAAAITNDLMQRQATRLAELNKANFLSDRDYKREMGRLQAEFADRLEKQHDNRVKTAWLNKTSPYFDVNPITGMPLFKPGNAEAKFRQMYNGSGQGTGEGLASYKSFYDQALKAGMTENQAREYAYNKSGADQHKTQTFKGYNNMPSTTRVSGEYSRIGGMVPHYQIGGSFLPVNAGPEVNFSDMPPEAMQQMPQQMPQQQMAAPALRGKTKRMSNEDIATATHNPGNMKYASWMSNVGGQPSGIAGKDGGEFASFPTFQMGLAAYKEQLFGDTDGIFKSNYYKPHTTVHSALKTWSNNGYGGEIYPEVKNKTLAQLTPAERDELVKRQIKAESNSTYRLLQNQGLLKNGGSVLGKFLR